MGLEQDIRNVARALRARREVKSGDLWTDGVRVMHNDETIIERMDEGRFRICLGRDAKIGRIKRINEICKLARIPCKAWQSGGEFVVSWTDDEGKRYTCKVLPQDEVYATQKGYYRSTQDDFVKNTKDRLVEYKLESLRSLLSMAENRGEKELAVILRQEIAEREMAENALVGQTGWL